MQFQKRFLFWDRIPKFLARNAFVEMACPLVIPIETQAVCNASRKWSYSSRSSYYLVGKRTQAPEPTTPGFAVKPTAGLLQLKCKQRSAFRHLTSSSTFYFIRILVLYFFLCC